MEALFFIIQTSDRMQFFTLILQDKLHLFRKIEGRAFFVQPVIELTTL